MLKTNKLQGLLLVLVFTLGSQTVWAQELTNTADTNSGIEQDCGLTISGKVIDHDTREPLIGATVHLDQPDMSAVADEYGNYHFHHLCQGTYTLKVSYVGYKEESFTYKITASSVRDLQLHADTKLLKAVEVTGAHLTEQAQATATLSGRELEETRGLSLGESLKALTGVSSIQTGPNVSKPVIHGLFGNRVLLLNNGVRHESQQWGNEHAPEIDPLNAQEMTVVKGASGVRYGSDAIGGVVLVNPKPLPDSAGVKGKVSLIGSTNNRMGTVAGMLEGKLSQLPLSWRVHTSVKKAGSAQAPDYNLKNTGFEEQNLATTLGYKQAKFGAELYYSYFHTKIGILSSSHAENLTDLNNAIGRERPEQIGEFSYDINRPYQDVTHHLLKAKGTYKTGDVGELQFTYGFQQNLRDEYDVLRQASNKPQLSLKLLTHSTELVWEHKPISNFSGSIGTTTLWQDNTYAQGSRYLLPYYQNFTAGIFWMEKWRQDNLELEAGVRYDHKNLNVKAFEGDELLKPEYTFHNFSGSLGAMYDLGYHLTLSGNASYASRAPIAYELFARGKHNGTGSYEFGDPDLTSENAINTMVTLNYHSNYRFNSELSLYNNYISNYIYLQLGEPVLAVDGAYLTGYYKQADAHFWGADLSLQYNITDMLSLDTKASIVYAINTETDSYLPFISPARIDNTLRYSLGNLGSEKLSETYIAAGGLLVDKQHRYDEQSDPLLSPPDGYFLLHAAVGTNIQVGNTTLDVSITGNNLLNTSYRDYQNRLRYFTDEIGRTIMFRVGVPLNIKNS
ncbi:TonB-dependent receptor [Pontibacter silvestris]|uniref:TonB-dependent receptor n=1 Tax=Pontibacter silvestris TaxID=2305183 RepID=A0ABW4X271_9BACT|nr:TonB-dependent receptor [Pontibacter silvestris]MCC9135838.1 TonB-dependent receptor [Pontibacter silvestris]